MINKFEESLSKLINENKNKKVDEAVNPDHVRKYAPGYVGPKFAKVASDEDIIKMTELKDEIGKIHNQKILPIKLQIADLRKQYKIGTDKNGLEK